MKRVLVKYYILTQREREDWIGLSHIFCTSPEREKEGGLDRTSLSYAIYNARKEREKEHGIGPFSYIIYKPKEAEGER